MADLSLLSPALLRRIELCFPLSRRIVRIDDRRIVSAVVFMTENGPRRRLAPREERR
jgi:hypothetical protein